MDIDEQNQRYIHALLIGITLSPEYIHRIANPTDYVQILNRNNLKNRDEFHLKENNSDRMADYIADYLSSKGYSAYSQSEDHLCSIGYYDEKQKPQSYLIKPLRF